MGSIQSIPTQFKTVKIYWIDPVRMGQIETIENVEDVYTEDLAVSIEICAGPGAEDPDKRISTRIIPLAAVGEIVVEN